MGLPLCVNLLTAGLFWGLLEDGSDQDRGELRKDKAQSLFTVNHGLYTFILHIFLPLLIGPLSEMPLLLRLLYLVN